MSDCVRKTDEFRKVVPGFVTEFSNNNPDPKKIAYSTEGEEDEVCDDHTHCDQANLHQPPDPGPLEPLELLAVTTLCRNFPELPYSIVLHH